jgi:hypothetical protein
MKKQFMLWLSFAVTIAGFSQTQTEVEPNNTFLDANEISPGDIQGSIDPVGDADFYVFDVPISGVITASIINVPSNINFRIALFNEAQNLIAQTANFIPNGTVLNFEMLVTPGTYYIRLVDIGNSDSNPQLYTLIFGLDTSDVHEWNNTFQTATPVSLDTSILATIRSRGDADYYVFDVPESGVITANIFNVPSNINFRIALFNEVQNLIAQTANFIPNGNNLNFEMLVTPGTYYIRLVDIGDSDSSPQLYTLNLGLDTSDVHEWNNTFQTATPVSLDTSILATIRSRGDADYYVFDVPKSGIVTANIFNVPLNINFRIALFNEAQNLVAQTANFVPNGSNLNFEMLVPFGTYYIRIVDIGDSDSSPQLYTLNLGLDTADVHEWNNTFQTATLVSLDTTILAAIRSQGDKDFFKFNVSTDGELNVEITNVPANIACRLALYDGSQNLIDQTPGFAPNGSNLSYNRFLLAGTYYIRVMDIGDFDTNSQLYTMDMVFAPVVNTENEEGPSMSSINIFPNPVTDSKLFIHVPTSAYGDEKIDYSIYDLKGSVLLEGSLLGSEGYINLDKLTRGTYSLELKASNQSVWKKIIVM